MKFVLARTGTQCDPPIEVLDFALAKKLNGTIEPIDEFFIGKKSASDGEAHFMAIVEMLMKHDHVFATGFRSALTRSARYGFIAGALCPRDSTPPRG